MTRQGKRPGISATELMAQLQNDPEYQRKVKAVETERQVRAQELSRGEQPIVTALQDAAVNVESVWDLVNTSDPYPAALPVLMEYFERGGYPDRVMNSLGRALAVKPSVAYWDRLKTRWLEARGPGEEDGAAVALAACATPAQLDDLITFLSLDGRGQSRVYFVGPILRVGGDRGRDVVESLLGDPVFAREAAAMLKRLRS